MSPPRDIAYHERVSLLQGTVQSILPQLHKGEEFRWTSRLKALLLEGLGRLERGGSPEDEGGMEGLLLLYGKAVDLWCREQSEQPLPAPYARQRTLVHRAGDRLWALRAQRLQPIEYLRLGRHFCSQGPPEVRQPWFHHHPLDLAAWVGEILAAPGLGTWGVSAVDLALTASRHEQDWDLATEILEQELTRSTARYIDLFDVLQQANRPAELQLALRRALADDRYVGPAVREHAEHLLTELY